MPKLAMFVDVTKCVGCRACTVACKQWNKLPMDKTHFTGSYQNLPGPHAHDIPSRHVQGRAVRRLGELAPLLPLVLSLQRRPLRQGLPSSGER